VAWRDMRNYLPDLVDLLDVYSQRVTAAGTIAPGWPADGVPLCNAHRDQDGVAIASDGGRGCICGLARPTRLLREPALSRHLPPAGHGEWQHPTRLECGWNPGVHAIGQQWFAKVAADGSGGVYVVWEDARRDLSLDPTQSDIYAQHISAQGTVVDGWPVDGLAVCMAPGTRGKISLLPDGVGGVLVLWLDGRDLASTGADIYAQRLQGDGSLSPGWNADGMPVSRAPGNQQTAPNSTVAPDGAGGFLVAWDDTRGRRSTSTRSG